MLGLSCTSRTALRCRHSPPGLAFGGCDDRLRRVIRYSGDDLRHGGAAAYWMRRWSLSSGGPLRRPHGGYDDGERTERRSHGGQASPPAMVIAGPTGTVNRISQTAGSPCNSGISCARLSCTFTPGSSHLLNCPSNLNGHDQCQQARSGFEHDPGKWRAFFRMDHAQTRTWSGMTMSSRSGGYGDQSSGQEPRSRKGGGS